MSTALEIKRVSWVGVGTDDFPRALAFYTEVLGLKPAVVDARGVALLHAGPGQVLEIFGPGTTVAGRRHDEQADAVGPGGVRLGGAYGGGGRLGALSAA